MGNELQPAITSVSPLSGSQKVALLLLSLPKEQAESILGSFDPEEIEALRNATADLPSVDAHVVLGLIDEFEIELCNDLGFMGISEEVENLLHSVSEKKDGAPVLDLDELDVWKELSGLDDEIVLDFLGLETAATSALILSRMDPAVAARLLPLMSPEQRAEAVRNMVRQTQVSAFAIEVIEQALMELILQNSQGDLSAENRRKAANMMNRVDDDIREELLEQLFESDPEDARALQNLLFSFNDISKLDAAGCGVLFDSVNVETVIAALVGAEDNVREMALSALSARARRMVEVELSAEPAVSDADIKQARREIAEQALRLIQDGAIQIETSEDQ